MTPLSDTLCLFLFDFNMRFSLCSCHLQLHRNFACRNARGILCAKRVRQTERQPRWQPAQCNTRGNSSNRRWRWRWRSHGSRCGSSSRSCREATEIQAGDSRSGPGGGRCGTRLLFVRRAVDKLIVAHIHNHIGDNVANADDDRKCQRQIRRRRQRRQRPRQRQRKRNCANGGGTEAAQRCRGTPQAAASCALLRREELLGLDRPKVLVNY